MPLRIQGYCGVGRGLSRLIWAFIEQQGGGRKPDQHKLERTAWLLPKKPGRGRESEWGRADLRTGG